MNNLLLLPSPRSITLTGGQYTLDPGLRIVLDSPDPSSLLFSARRLQAALREHAKLHWELSATTTGPVSEIGAVLRIVPGKAAHPQGYELSITSDGILAEAPSVAGIFYAVCTL